MECLHNDLEIVKTLIAECKMYHLTAIVDLTNSKQSLILEVPGWGKSKYFSLTQASEVIISILCKEIPYIISDLLCVIKLPVFYKGFLAMKINGQLSLLEPTTRSLETDLRCLFLQVPKRRRTALERLFWLKTRGPIQKCRQPSVWCPAKETYRSYLRALIDCKLCHDLVSSESKRLTKRFRIFKKLSSKREQIKKPLESILKFEAPVLSLKVVLLSKQNCYPSNFNVHYRPSDLANKNNDKSIRMRENWLEIYCNERRNGLKTNGKVELEQKVSEDTADEESKRIKKSVNVAVRIIHDPVGHYWAKPILPEPRESSVDMTVYAPQPSFLGNLCDCQEYLLRLFSSVSDQQIFTLVIDKTSINDESNELMNALPPQIRKVCNASKNCNGISNGEMEQEDYDICENLKGAQSAGDDNSNLIGLQNVRCTGVKQSDSQISYMLRFHSEQ